MARTAFEPGSEEVETYFRWINERHRIFLKRDAGEPKPWTDDEPMLAFKFTNAFRELDRGTIALRRMIETFWNIDLGGRGAGYPVPSYQFGPEGAALIAWNIIWYRLFNVDTHAVDPGFCVDPSLLADRLRRKKIYGEQIFTAAHMTVGKAGISKLEFMLPTCEQIFEDREAIVAVCRDEPNLMKVATYLLRYMGIGKFIAYEIVTDFRWYDSLLGDANDINFWVNIGPGCMRGLRRLGLAENMRSIAMLWELAPDYLEGHVITHHSKFCGAHGMDVKWPPFELREVEHSLCEFDKWCRITRGEGRSRQRFNGRS